IIEVKMSNLESRLDEEVNNYLQIVETKEEVQKLLSASVTLNIYRKFLITFYIIEYLSQKAVKKASKNTSQANPYLSKRFDVCAKGELGHADIALKDLSDIGEKDFELKNKQLVEEYDKFLQQEADDFPLGILGHSYLFENVSGILFPKNKPLDYPSKFIEVHAKEDPGHSQAIKKTVRNIESDISEEDIEKIIVFSRKSGEYLLKLFDTV
ncbi:MAG: hypothetical protein ACR2NW_10735, partial [Thermodesulfobacteriota bacterium]